MKNYIHVERVEPTYLEVLASLRTDGEEKLCPLWKAEKIKKRKKRKHHTAEERRAYAEQKRAAAERAEHARVERNMPQLESCERIFAMCQGRRTYKKPGSGGSYRVNPPLRRMALCNIDYELNRPLPMGVCIQGVARA